MSDSKKIKKDDEDISKKTTTPSDLNQFDPKQYTL
jgi:hypothetical protein